MNALLIIVICVGMFVIGTAFGLEISKARFAELADGYRDLQAANDERDRELLLVRQQLAVLERAIDGLDSPH